MSAVLKHEVGLGFARYARAMSLYQSGTIGADTLEIFRICAPDDGLDPRQELARSGIVKDLPEVEVLLTST